MDVDRSVQPSLVAIDVAARCALMADLFETGVTPSLQGEVLQQPQLAEALLAFSTDPSGQLDWEDAAAVHAQIVGFSVPPFAGVYVDPQALVGGGGLRAAEIVEERASVALDRSGDGIEHISNQLRTLARCCQDLYGERCSAQEVADVAAGLLLPWITPFAGALRAEGHGFYSALAQSLWQTVVTLPEHLGVGASPVSFGSGLQGDVGLLQRPETGLKDIARWLTTPAKAGLLFGRGRLGRIAARVGLPVAIGGRRAVLESLLFSAVDHDRLPDLCRELAREAVAEAVGHGDWAQGATGQGEGAVEPWLARIQGCVSALDHLAAAASREPGQTAPAEPSV